MAYKITKDRKNQTQEVSNGNQEENVLTAEIKKEKKVQIFQGDSRPIAVMIDNHNGAWPQAGLNQAYMVYEIIVEGGETFLLVRRFYSGNGFNDCGNEKRFVNIDATAGLINNFHGQNSFQSELKKPLTAPPHI